jgi:hypothetical protein
MLGFIILAISFVVTIVWLWAGGIDYMRENHPDYKGEDLFGEDKQTKDESNT